MTNKGYMAFMPDWREYKKELTPEKWYELEDYMFQLRFDNIDTEPSSIQDKEVRIIWRSIRPQLKKIIRNYNYKQKSKNNQDMQPNTEFDSEVENKPNKTEKTEEYPNPQPKAESPSEGQESGKNEVLETVSSTNVDEAVKIGADAIGETEKDDNGIGGWDIADTPSEQWFVFDDNVVEEYERKLKEKEDMIKQEVIDKFKDIRYNSPEYWKAMREVIDPLPSCDKDTAIREINEYFKAA